MARLAVLLLASSALALAALAWPAAAAVTIEGVGAAELGWAARRSACRGTVGECVDGEDDGDGAVGLGAVARRALQASSGYIGYGALQRDSVPCSQRGASYYNCQPGAQANPYSRGCNAITQCRGG